MKNLTDILISNLFFKACNRKYLQLQTPTFIEKTCFGEIQSAETLSKKNMYKNDKIHKKFPNSDFIPRPKILPVSDSKEFSLGFPICKNLKLLRIQR